MRSVHAVAPWAIRQGAAARLETCIEASAASIQRPRARLRMCAANKVPVPIGLVKINTSPGRMPPLRMTDVRSSAISPLTENPSANSLQTANLRLCRVLRNLAEATSHPNFALLFDPQTAGGLLASLPVDQVDACIAELHNLGYRATRKIGRILAQGDALQAISLKQ